MEDEGEYEEDIECDGSQDEAGQREHAGLQAVTGKHGGDQEGKRGTISGVTNIQQYIFSEECRNLFPSFY